MKRKIFFVYMPICIMISANIIAQESNADYSFNVSKTTNPNDTANISTKVTRKDGENVIKISAKNTTLLGIYQKAYGFPEEKFLIPQHLDYIRSYSYRYNLEFEGVDKDHLIRELDAFFTLKTEKVIQNVLCLMLYKIAYSPDIKPAEKISERKYTTMFNNYNSSSLTQGIISAKEISDLLCKDFNCMVMLDGVPEDELYEIYLSIDNKSREDELISSYKEAGIFLEKRTLATEYVQFTDGILR